MLQTTIPGITIPLRFAYYALERADSDMEAVIANEQWPAESLLEAFRVMVRSVQRIHNRGIAHRDLKPGNFLLCGGLIKLSDFGTARSLRENEIPLLTNYSFPPGDLRYCPPEMVACLHDVDPDIAFQADFFALGSILFELFTGVNLGVQMFGPTLLTAVLAPLAAVPRDQRHLIFQQTVGSLAVGYPLPAIDSLNPNIPPCIRDRLDDLYKGLCQLDYRQRTVMFSSVFRSIDTCLLILKNEATYLRWLREKQKRRAIKMQKRAVGASI
jgi:serine/threonine protein kinase